MIFQKLSGRGPEGKLGNANGLISLGNIYARLGRYKKAIGYQEKAIEILLKMRKEPARGQRKKKTIKKTLQLNPEDITIKREKALGIAYGNMGHAHNELEDYEKGLRLSQEALKINKKSGDKLEEARNLLNIGNAYCHSGRPKKSIEYCEESARISKEIGNKKCESSSYGVLATSYQALGDIATSQHFYQKCIDINHNMNQFADLAIVYGNNGLLDYKVGLRSFLSFGDAKESLERSVENFKLAIESTDEVLISLSVDNNRTAFSHRFYRWYDSLTAPFIFLGRSAAALLFLDLGRAKILRQLVYKQVNPKENHEDQSIFESSWLTIQNKKEKERICALTKKIQLLESDATVVFYNFNRAEILTIWILDANGCVFLKTSDPGENSLTAQEELENNLKKMLDQGSVVLPRGYSFFNSSEVVDTKAKDVKSRVETASHPESDKEVKVSETERDYRSPAKRSDKRCDDLAKETRSSLYRALISPVKSFIKGTKLIIVPQRCLFFAPFSSFIDENGCLLSEKYQIQIIPSIHVLAMSIQSSSDMPIGNSLFVGDPEVQPAGLSRLPWAAEEVACLASLLNSKPLLGAMATKSKLLELMPKASIIHIAAHGHEETGHIYLAPETSKATTHQALLTQSDILKFKLIARLVVLSCCDTGKGEVSSEGVLGIARSFLGAGASSVLVTLWKINDKFPKSL